MAGLEEAPAYDDVLDSGTPNRRPWTALAVVVVLALIGWSLRGPEPEPAIIPIAVSTAPSTSVAEPEPEPEFSQAPDSAGELAFVDDRHGFLMQYRCSQLRSDGTCPRRLLATSDGGRTWDSRGAVPSYADSFYPLVAISAREIVLIDGSTFGSLARSIDGGLNWVLLPIDRGPPAPAPTGPTVLQAYPQSCNARYATDCPVTAVWIDVVRRTLHPLPQQPPTDLDQYLGLAPMSPDGELVASSSGITSAEVAMSVDGGRSWTEAVLDVPVESSDALQGVQALPAGNGRAYAFVQVYDQIQRDILYGFRTDDAGLSWVGLGWELTGVDWHPSGVLDGELVATTASGGTVVSTAGGTRWAPLDGAPSDGWLSQSVPGGPVLMAGYDGLTGERYHLSLDGRTWKPVHLPA